MDSEEFEFVMDSGSSAPYTTMLKELAETVILVSSGVTQCSTKEYSEEALKMALRLLHGELEIQLTYQQDLLVALRERKAAEAAKAKSEKLKSNNVVPLKGA